MLKEGYKVVRRWKGEENEEYENVNIQDKNNYNMKKDRVTVNNNDFK
jgi:hypothetical protein